MINHMQVPRLERLRTIRGDALSYEVVDVLIEDSAVSEIVRIYRLPK